MQGAGDETLLAVLDELGPLLEAVESSGVPDAWLGAGAIRNRVWDRRFGVETPRTDWDVAFLGPCEDAERRLADRLPGPWEAVDQRRYGHASVAEALASWPETATAVGARLKAGRLELLAPWGLDDLLRGVLRRSPGFDAGAYTERAADKRFGARWPELSVEPTDDARAPRLAAHTFRVPSPAASSPRDAGESELDALSELWLHAWRDAHAALVPEPLVRSRTFASFRDRLRGALADVRVVGPSARPMGFCLVIGDEVSQLFVAARARGTGVAQALMADAEQRLNRAGVRTAWLTCAQGNTRAARFYERCGWRRVSDEISRAPLGRLMVEVPVWRYEKRLSGAPG